MIPMTDPYIYIFTYMEWSWMVWVSHEIPSRMFLVEEDEADFRVSLGFLAINS